jgi:hypothetical protein
VHSVMLPRPSHSMTSAIVVQPWETLVVVEGLALFARLHPLSSPFHCVMLGPSHNTGSSDSPFGFLQPPTDPLLEAAACGWSFLYLFIWLVDPADATTMAYRAHL